ncbi:J domain-containing protein [Sphaerobacter sp.]|uniref:J domain-containing protein n=1 Tax=Sphaerobacter sp. TaxID=2099654 RepID=UPI001DA42316|nr:J domain-containing protein [Sphaerobacter sp.]MBX5446661.1 J domain-containing protein [Sphaerobacter sp.]
MTVRDAFSVIGLPPARYTDEELHAAYRRKAAEVHPDRGGSREAWDELEAAYALLLTHGQDYAAPPSGSTDMLGSHTWWRWRTSGRLVRVLVVLVVGALVALLLWQLFREAASVGISWQFPAVFSGYVASWWLWWLWREAGRRAAKPITWFGVDTRSATAEGLRQVTAWLKARANAEGYSEERPYK